VRRKPFAIVISGPSGAGKSTCVKHLMERFPDLRFSVSATTRPQRSGEQEGRDYIFLQDAAFLARVAAGDFLEHAQVHGSRYGTLRSEVQRMLVAGHGVLLDVDVQGGVEIKRTLPESVLIFVMPPSMAELERRLRQRSTESEATIQRRLQRAPDEIRQLIAYDYVVVNDRIEMAHRELEAIVAAERLRRSRLTDATGSGDPVAEYLGEAPKPLHP
jgi:guanylate kinase